MSNTAQNKAKKEREVPLYLFHAENILEINTVTETDSYRKCKSAHRRAARLGCILFPELLSGDGRHILYFAPLKWKEYGKYFDDMREPPCGTN